MPLCFRSSLSVRDRVAVRPRRWYVGCDVGRRRQPMQRTQGVFLGLASLALVFAVSAQALAQQDGPAAQAPGAQRPPSPTAPAAPSPSSSALGQAQASTTATGELTDVDAKTKTLTVKTATGSEMKFKYDDSTKIGGADKSAAGLATMTGRQVTIQYKKDGQSNIASNVEVHAATSPSPGSPSPTPPRSPDPTAPRAPGAPDPTSPRAPGQPDAPRP